MLTSVLAPYIYDFFKLKNVHRFAAEDVLFFAWPVSVFFYIYKWGQSSLRSHRGNLGKNGLDIGGKRQNLIH